MPTTHGFHSRRHLRATTEKTFSRRWHRPGSAGELPPCAFCRRLARRIGAQIVAEGGRPFSGKELTLDAEFIEELSRAYDERMSGANGETGGRR